MGATSTKSSYQLKVPNQLSFIPSKQPRIHHLNFLFGLFVNTATASILLLPPYLMYCGAGVDVKVYAVGTEYAHAEARKAPTLDGKVQRDSGGNEVSHHLLSFLS